MKVSHLLVGGVLLSLALLVIAMPAANVGAQDATATPQIVIITATPSDNSQGSTDQSATEAGPSTEAPVSATAAATADASDPWLKPRQTAEKLLVKNGVLSSNYLTQKLFKKWTHDLIQIKNCPPTDSKVVLNLPKDEFGYLLSFDTYTAKHFDVWMSFDYKTIYQCNAGGTTAAASNSGPAVAGHVVAGPFEAGAQMYGWSLTLVGYLHTAGMTWIKKQIVPPDGSYAGIISTAHASNFKVLLSVVGSNSDIASGSGYFDAYASYVGKLAAAGADGIEVWNEENIDRQWPTGNIDPKNYVPLLQKAYAAIKAANPNTIVISGALAPTGYWGGSNGMSANGWDDDVYYQGMAAAGAAQYMDCVGVHYNEGVVSPTQTSGDPRDNYPTRYYATMLSRALSPFPGMKACFTELGYLTPQGYGPLPGGFAWAQNTTIAEQAQWLSQAAVLSSQSNVRLMIVFNMDFVRYDSDPQAGYAMQRTDGTCPACTAMGQVLH